MHSELLLCDRVNFLELRCLTPELLPATVSLDRLCFGGLWTLEGYQRELDSPNSDLIVLLPTAPPTNHEPRTTNHEPLTPPILGYACLWAILDEAHITIVAVHPDYHRQGLGQTLLVGLLQSAHQRGLKHATLEVRISNQSAIALYQKFEFRTAGQRKHYYADTGEDALILWRGGLQHPDFPQRLANWQAEVRDQLQQHGWALYPGTTVPNSSERLDLGVDFR